MKQCAGAQLLNRVYILNYHLIVILKQLYIYYTFNLSINMSEGADFIDLQLV